MGWLLLFENFALINIGPSGIVTGLFASNRICKFELRITSSFRVGACSDPGGRADVKAHSSSSLTVVPLCCDAGACDDEEMTTGCCAGFANAEV
jgi:hypothetical protein